MITIGKWASIEARTWLNMNSSTIFDDIWNNQE